MFFCIDPDLTELTPEYARQVATDHLVPLMAGISAKQVEFGAIKGDRRDHQKFCPEGQKRPHTAIFFFFNNLSPKTAVDKLLAAARAVRIYGAPGADENTPYELPSVIPFEEFLRDKIRHNQAGYAFHWLKVSSISL